jgi:hypothetical protein
MKPGDLERRYCSCTPKATPEGMSHARDCGFTLYVKRHQENVKRLRQGEAVEHATYTDVLAAMKPNDARGGQ